MKTNIIELVFILDKSGSMSGLEGDTIGGYNAMLIKQQQEQGEVIVTTVLFDDNYELLHDRINIRGIGSITEKDYFVGGCTALLDAIGKTIHKIGNAQKHTSEECRADKVMFVITTDGIENASKEFTCEKIKYMIQRQKEKYDWEFIFLGANIDAISTAAKFGIGADRAANYNADGKGTRLNYESVSNVVSEFRASKKIDERWKEKIDKDFAQRNKRRKG
ncbi:VWA domain-containing protein [Clostridium swellfunianum]|uniref:vWA domain-containing protein n=1 Tax=Clostridium swellfunianum TaxID=1367462 RepID=UPI00202FD8F3|nr:vWA domain-containing protein [Clostridium swellfunianum]MCM0646898.1 VWA domain-containing protein [Clostridium swellfunianum]